MAKTQFCLNQNDPWVSKVIWENWGGDFRCRLVVPTKAVKNSVLITKKFNLKKISEKNCLRWLSMSIFNVFNYKNFAQLFFFNFTC